MIHLKNTTYRELADLVFNKIKDRDLCSINSTIAYEIVLSYLPSACIKFQNCTQDLDDKDDMIQEFGFALSDTNKEILANYMVIEWLTSNFILTQQALKSRLTTSDYHALGNKDMLSQARQLRSELMEENDQLARNKSYLVSNLYNIAAGKKV